ncbi:tripartite tricarboxylate transporter permease [Phytoactinopolyspora halotolerans]|uniref:Tripartite tricarboxylate transporter permease n=1 Tax=Phytoactinopolyspora halotolerans TaxID=1981512 RepID=A0A6L9S7D3_9ACTN|nr:tripartite tricarboxylate transporter permease [Phytoactinopolyspora halotolerans]NEE00873.1 tripartite tricarboxylate transporter permease [Phytoactinopolyspora halotolerans]
MDVLSNFAGGLELALSAENLLFVLLGVSVGMMVGVLPGLGPAPTVALLLPITFGLDSTTAIILLAGVYYGAMYGGTITSVLLRIPGEAASVVSTVDGHEMAKNGQAGRALGLAAIGSFIGGLVATACLILFAPALADFALSFGSPEYAVLALLGLILVSYTSAGTMTKSLIAVGIGLILATIGQDPMTGGSRWALGVPALLDGIDEVAVIMGLFGLSEILNNVADNRRRRSSIRNVGRVLPTGRDLRENAGAIGRGSVIGTGLGLVPGGGGVLGSLVSYGVERKVSATPERFGRGAPQAVSGPETANNSASISTFIPLLTLGFPPNGVLAVIFGALLIQGVTPGPTLIADHPEIFWGVVGSMVIGNVMLLIMNIPLVPLFVKIAEIPPEVLAALTVAILIVGAYSINGNAFDVGVMVAAGIAGYLLRRLGIPPAPIVLAFILGPIFETNFRRSLILSDGSFGIFVSSPVTVVLLIAAMTVLASAVLPKVRRARETIEAED